MIQTDIDFLSELIDSIIDERSYDTPSEYIERVRYIPKGTSPKPGFFEFDYTPYLREPFNLLAPDSGIERIVFMKPAQIGYTVGFLQNAVLYHIGSNPKRVQFVTADNQLAEETVKTQINPMIEHSGLEKLIFAQSKPKGSRATGSTNVMKEYPGGYVRFVGAKNPDAARGRSFERSLYDEIDAWDDDKKEGSKIALFDNRSNAFAATRKTVYGSTPLILQTSNIYRLYKEGDQRNFFITCPRCGKMIVLKWHIVSDDGEKCGIIFEHEKGIPIYETVRYRCPECKGDFKDYEKVKFLNPDQCKWIATEKAIVPRTASYWINALYAPPGMYSWERIVEDWVKAWDLEYNRPKNMEAYREFRNTKQGLPFEEQGESISYEKAMIHRRDYPAGTEFNNQKIKEEAGSEILIIICSVDLQKNNLFVDVKGYTYGGRTYSLEFFSLDGETENINGPSWAALDEILCHRIYTDETGRQYRISNTFIDSGKYTQQAMEFCKQYSGGVFAIKGERYISGGIPFKPMSKMTLEKWGVPMAYLINTTLFKDEISRYLNRLQWNTGDIQPPWYPNFPQSYGDDYFNQFAAESKVDERDPRTGKWKGSFWRQKGNADNHAFDTYGYNLCSLYEIAEYTCLHELELTSLDWTAFWDYAKTGVFYIDK